MNTQRRARHGLAHVLMTGLLLAAAACGGDDEGGTTDEVPSFEGELSGTILDEHFARVEGVEVCVFERAEIPCTETLADGTYALALPIDEDLIVSYVRTGFHPKLRMYRSSGQHHGAWLMQTDAWVENLLADHGMGAVSDRAVVTMQADGITEGVSFSLTPVSTSGTGPLYFDGNLDIDEDLEATGFNGLGGYVNVEAAEYRAQATVDGGVCTPLSWDDEGQAVAIALPGFVTHVAFDCQ